MGTKKRKLRVRENRDDYQAWLKNMGGNDPASLEGVWDGFVPWYGGQVSDTADDYLEIFGNMIPSLKGRQKQIAIMLQEGEYNQTKIAQALGISRNHVIVELRRLAKKIEKVFTLQR